MNGSVNQMMRFTVLCTDGEAGSVSDLYFDDEKWVVRYLVVETGSWLISRQVLISPYSVEAVDWRNRRIRLTIDREKVRKSPDMDLHKPLSRQREAEYHTYFGYPYYWGGTSVWGGSPTPASVDRAAVGRAPLPGILEAPPSAEHDTHLRSADEIIGYHIKAIDGKLGHIEDLTLNEDSWALESVVIDTSNWPGGTRIELPVEFISRFSWPEGKAYIDMNRDRVRAIGESRSHAR